MTSSTHGPWKSQTKRLKYTSKKKNQTPRNGGELPEQQGGVTQPWITGSHVSSFYLSVNEGRQNSNGNEKVKVQFCTGVVSKRISMKINLLFLCARVNHWEQAGKAVSCCETSPANRKFNWKGIKKLVHCTGIHTALVTQEAGRLEGSVWPEVQSAQHRVRRLQKPSPDWKNPVLQRNAQCSRSAWNGISLSLISHFSSQSSN